ncbi:MAG: chromosome segregation protein ScpA [Euryarchaeota archaeon]|nr:chromosome segregation protein ScpA [Euryarchaeota archaeon]
MMGCAGAEKVLEHLMFHKAIIDENDRAIKIDHYLSILGEGEHHIAPNDPLDRSLETVFELVLNNDLDPWDIDLMKFSRLYTEKVREEEVNFIIAGRLMLMAWSILRMQSESVLERSEIREEEISEPWDPDFFDFFDEEPVVQLRMPEEVDLDEVVRRRGSCPVTLVDLLDAFEEARIEQEENKRREKIRAANRVKTDKFDTKAHSDDMERDVEEVWQRILKCGPGPIRLEDIWNGGKDDIIMVFTSLLFLVRSNKISVWQDDLPFGTISLEVRMDWDIGTLEDANPDPLPLVTDREAVM